MTRALYLPPRWFDDKQRRLYLKMMSPSGHYSAMRQDDPLARVYRLGFAEQNRRRYPYPRSSLAYSRDDRVIVGLLVIAAVASTLSAILFVTFSAGLVLGVW